MGWSGIFCTIAEFRVGPCKSLQVTAEGLSNQTTSVPDGPWYCVLVLRKRFWCGHQAWARWVYPLEIIISHAVRILPLRFYRSPVAIPILRSYEGISLERREIPSQLLIIYFHVVQLMIFHRFRFC